MKTISDELITLDQLQLRARAMAGLTLAEFFQQQHEHLPSTLLRDKGTIGQKIETYLGASAGTLAEPDFPHLGIELKTIPVNPQGVPWESTYVCHVQFDQISLSTWETSLVRKKLNHVLWVPIIAENKKQIPAERIIGAPLLWKMDPASEKILREDWQELTDLIATGHLETINAHYGHYLQIRPKGANNRALCRGTGADGEPINTLPRGFYLRSRFTQGILKKYYA